jgi:deoxyribonuclease-4
MLFGAHVSTAGGIHTAVDRIEAIGGNALQIFTQSSRAWRLTSHDPDNLERFRKRRAEVGLGAVLCHAIYLINLASADDELFKRSRATLNATVDVACAIAADGVVFHIGSHLGAGFDAGLKRAIPALRRALEHCSDSTWLLVENSAGAGGTIGRSVEELAIIVDRLDAHPRLGICLDSCHLWVSGADVTNREALDEIVDEVSERIGLDRLRALHVNDAKDPLGSNRDRHANLGEGLIGNGLSVFLGHPRLQGLPAILEVPGANGRGPESADVRKLKKLHERGIAQERKRRRR